MLFNKNWSKNKGFTLAEIMIVIAVLMILAFLVVPNMLRANVTSNEAIAIANLRNLHIAILLYYNDNNKTYPTQLAQMQNYISPALASGEKSGYIFLYARDGLDEFHANANPRTVGRTGNRYFYLDEEGIIKYNTEEQAGADDPVTE